VARPLFFLLYVFSHTTQKEKIVVWPCETSPKQLLSLAEEEEFSKLLIEIEVVQVGYGKTRKEVRSIAGRGAVDKGRKDKSTVSHGWFQRFLQGNHIYHTARETLQPMCE